MDEHLGVRMSDGTGVCSGILGLDGYAGADEVESLECGGRNVAQGALFDGERCRLLAATDGIGAGLCQTAEVDDRALLPRPRRCSGTKDTRLHGLTACGSILDGDRLGCAFNDCDFLLVGVHTNLIEADLGLSDCR